MKGLLLTAVLAGATSPVGGDASKFCQPGPNPNSLPVIWCAEVQAITLREVAGLGAPALWFSPDEPLIVRRGRDLPQAIPFGEDEVRQDPLDRVQRQPATVYYLVTDLLPKPAWGDKLQNQIARCTRNRDRKSLASCSIDLEQVERIRVRYFFYYEEDIGPGAHINDLEELEVEMKIERESPELERYRILLQNAKGKAHGYVGYTNFLHPGAQDEVNPLFAFVEEGKHAVSPDRNADGLFNLGYDVNRKTGDAWGVRDTFSGSLPAPRFSLDDFKPRTEDKLICPPVRQALSAASSWMGSGGRSESGGTQRAPHAGGSRSAPCDSTHQPRYELVSAHDVRDPADCVVAVKSEGELRLRDPDGDGKDRDGRRLVKLNWSKEREARPDIFELCTRMEKVQFHKPPRVRSRLSNWLRWLPLKSLTFNHALYGGVFPFNSLLRHLDTRLISFYGASSRTGVDGQFAFYVPFDAMTRGTLREGYLGIRLTGEMLSASEDRPQDLRGARWMLGATYTPSRARLVDWYVHVDHELGGDRLWWGEAGVEGRQLLGFLHDTPLLAALERFRLRVGVRWKLRRFDLQDSQLTIGIGW